MSTNVVCVLSDDKKLPEILKLLGAKTSDVSNENPLFKMTMCPNNLPTTENWARIGTFHMPAPEVKQTKKIEVCNLVAWGVLIQQKKKNQFDVKANIPEELYNNKDSPYGILYSHEDTQTGDVLIFMHQFSKILPGSDTSGGHFDMFKIFSEIGKPSKYDCNELVDTFGDLVNQKMYANSVRPYFFSFSCSQ